MSYSFEEIASDKSAKIEKVIYDKFHKIFGYKELIIGLEGDIAKMEKLNQLFAEEHELWLANGYPADVMKLLTAENDGVIGKRKVKIAEYQQKLEVCKAVLEMLKNKLATLKISKVAA